MSRTIVHRIVSRGGRGRVPGSFALRSLPFLIALAGLFAAAAFAADLSPRLADRSAWEVPPGAAHEAGRTGNALVVVHVRDIDDLWDFVDRWEDAGARFPHVYPPNVLIGDVSTSLESEMRGDPRFVEIHRDAVPASAGKDAAWQPVIDSWNAEIAMAASAGKNAPPEPTGEFQDLLLPPTNPVETDESPKTTGLLPLRYGDAYGATLIQSSELLMGKIAVAVIMPDAPGGSYADNETPVVASEARAAMEFWASRAGYPGVRFVYDLRPHVTTSHNFHEMAPSQGEAVWVDEIMNEMGFDGTVHGKRYSDELPHATVYDYLDSLRTAMRSEWGVVFFVPKITAFVGAGYTAYAYLGGPFLVVPSGQVRVHDGTAFVTSGSGGYKLSDLIIHESGHLFWALDEYAGGGTSTPCSATSGYLNIQNRNSSRTDYTCDAHRVSCCMNMPGPYACRYTLGMMGLWDSDVDPYDMTSTGNGIPDVLDTYPAVRALALPDTITTVYPSIDVIAQVNPETNRAVYEGTGATKEGRSDPRSDITFNTIEHVVYRVDDDVDDDGNPLWLYADPEGGFEGNRTLVNFSFVPTTLTGGEHIIHLRAINTTGNWSQSWTADNETLFVKAIAVDDFVAEPDYDGAVKLSYHIRGGTFGATARLYRSVDGGEETLVQTFPFVDDESKVIYDRDQMPGAENAYRLEGSALGLTWNWTASVVGPAPIEPGEHISRITPNPFRGSTMISVRVPRGDPVEHRPGGGGKPSTGGGGSAVPPEGQASPSFVSAATKYQQVRVEVDIFNVAGRRVRHFHPIHSYEGFYSDPIVWDGNDDSGRAVAQGIYFVRMKAGNEIRETRKVLLIR